MSLFSRGGDWTVSHNGHRGSVRNKLIELPDIRIKEGDAAVGPIMEFVDFGRISIAGFEPRAKRARFRSLAPREICCVLRELTVDQNQSTQFGILWWASSLFDSSFNLIEFFLAD